MVYLNKQKFFIFWLFIWFIGLNPYIFVETKTENMNIEKLALLICQYNGQKGTEKQVQKCLKMFGHCENLMRQWCIGRINLENL